MGMLMNFLGWCMGHCRGDGNTVSDIYNSAGQLLCVLSGDASPGDSVEPEWRRQLLEDSDDDNTSQQQQQHDSKGGASGAPPQQQPQQQLEAVLLAEKPTAAPVKRRFGFMFRS
jgi:hypothetical protein